MTSDSPDPSVLLELAGRDYRLGGSREQAIRDELNMSAVQFWLAVNRVLDDPPADVALAWGPLINWLRRLRTSRQRQRAPRRARTTVNRYGQVTNAPQ